MMEDLGKNTLEAYNRKEYIIFCLAHRQGMNDEEDYGS